MILKKNFLQALVGRKHCMQNKCNGNKFYHCFKKEKNVAKLFHHSGGLYKSQQNCNHSTPLLPLNSGFGDAAEVLLRICALLPYHKQ